MTKAQMQEIIDEQEKELIKYKKLSQEQERIIAYYQLLRRNSPLNNCKSKGRPAVSDIQKAAILNYKREGMSIRQISESVELSVGCVQKVISKAEDYPAIDDKLIKCIRYMNRNKPCTDIVIDFGNSDLHIINYTAEITDRAFGCIEHPNWNQFTNFLESRCFPKTRAGLKYVLKELGLQYYDPWKIVQKTSGKLTDDHQWIDFNVKALK